MLGYDSRVRLSRLVQPDGERRRGCNYSLVKSYHRRVSFGGLSADGTSRYYWKE